MNTKTLLLSALPATVFSVGFLFLGSALFEKARGTETQNINWAGISLFSLSAGAITGGALILQRVGLSFEQVEVEAKSIAEGAIAPQVSGLDDPDDLPGDIFDVAVAPATGSVQPGQPASVINFPSAEEISPPPPPFNPNRNHAQAG